MFEFLDKSVPITSQQWSEDTVPLVSISCITYNHEKYIRDAIEGFLMQKTTFPIEILIHDDASTDGTEEIIREYEVKYPHIIKPLYEVENQWVKGRRGSATFNFPRARGKYIALCEGDDYWTDPLKLQKQVEFLEENLEYSLIFHNSRYIYHTDRNIENVEILNKDYSADEVYIKWTIPTASMVFKASCIKYELLKNSNVYNGDLIIVLLAAQNGKLRGMHDEMSVYNIHEASILHSRSNKDKLLLERIKFLNQNLFIKKTFGNILTQNSVDNLISQVAFSISSLSLKKLKLKLFFKYMLISIKHNFSLPIKRILLGKY